MPAKWKICLYDVIGSYPDEKDNLSIIRIFSPQYLAIDTSTGIVYRKEQFIGDTKLPAEYVIRDKRYTMKEIVGLLENEGFTVVTSKYVRAGHFDDALRPIDKHAKEIPVIAKKETL